MKVMIHDLDEGTAFTNRYTYRIWLSFMQTINMLPAAAAFSVG